MSGPESDPAQAVVDLAFSLQGSRLPADYRFELLQALASLIPWLEEEPGAGIVGISATPTGSDVSLLSRRAKLTLRVPAARVPQARPLQGRAIRLGSDEIVIGGARERALQPSDTLYADMVVLASAEEAAFDRDLGALIRAEALDCRWILGRQRRLSRPGGILRGFAVALHGCKPALSLQLQRRGLGGERALGCGIFVAHKRIESPE
jgi:CRISPR-associated protein Cas6